VDGKLICVHDHHDFEQSKEEREYLINLAKPHMVKSTVVDAETCRSKD
jgi:prolyl 4-hydroxylase